MEASVEGTLVELFLDASVEVSFVEAFMDASVKVASTWKLPWKLSWKLPWKKIPWKLPRNASVQVTSVEITCAEACMRWK